MTDQLSLFASKRDATTFPPIPTGVCFGTSTWTYPGWLGEVYSKKYRTGQAPQMLAEYARYPLFDTVGIDSSFYAPLTEDQLGKYAAVLPPGFRCVSKVWENITVRRFADMDTDKARAGKLNPDFLNAELFKREVLAPFETKFADHVGPFVFELQATSPSDRPHDHRFCEELDRFFSQLPSGYEYAVELRDKHLMTRNYFATLRQHGVAHVYNAWTRMPDPLHQRHVEGEPTAPFAVSRLLLRPGRTYEEAVKKFQPYERIQEPNLEMRNEIVEIIGECRQAGRPIYVLVNNRLEGNAPATIRALAEMLSPPKGANPRDD